MANEKNLKPFGTGSVKVEREIQAKGRKANKENWAKRKSMREDMEYLLSLPCKDKKLIKDMGQLGFSTEGLNNQNALLYSVMVKAYRKGDIQAFNSIRELIGEKVTEIKLNTTIDEKVKQLNELLEK